MPRLGVGSSFLTRNMKERHTRAVFRALSVACALAVAGCTISTPPVPPAIAGSRAPPPELGPLGVVRLKVETEDVGVWLLRRRSADSPPTYVCSGSCGEIIDGRDGSRFQ